MTTTILSKSERDALQLALINSKLINSDTVNTDSPVISEQHAYSHIAVMLYRCNLHEIKWPYFLKMALTTATEQCQWLSSELIRCQQEYTDQSSEAQMIEQRALFNGIFSEELAYIDALLETKAQAE